MDYQIININRTTGDLTFHNADSQQTHVINCRQYADYRQVHPKHYYNVEHNEVIMVGKVSFRPFVILPPTIEDQGRQYSRCEQWQFDKWHTKEYPDSHNATIYHILIKELDIGI